MNRDQILQSAQRELETHDFSTFVEAAVGSSRGGVVVSGCPHCKLRLNTVPQFMRHLSEDVLPGIVDLTLSRRHEPESGDLPI